MEIEIPSPSVFLRQSPGPSANVPTSVKKTTKARGNAPTKPSAKSSTTIRGVNAQNGVTKPKQSKSRNGCLTCKKKRLKCDETKPTCTQCEKRKVECEGYKKDYKWRSFEDTTKQSRAGKARKAQNHTPPTDGQTQETFRAAPRPSSSHSNNEPSWTPGLSHAFTSAEQAFNGPTASAQTNGWTSPRRRTTPSQFDPLPILNPGFSPGDIDLPSPLPISSSGLRSRPQMNSSRTSFSTGSPSLEDILLPGTDLRQPPDPSEMRPPMSPLPYTPGPDEPDLPHDMTSQDEEYDEEVVRQQMNAFIPEAPGAQWRFRAHSPAGSVGSTSSSESTNLSLIKAPKFDPSSPEMLMLRFDRETCGILSIKDGPSENPWRTLIWPLARDSHALYHAISAMAALHGANASPQLRLTGMAHMTKSISKLSAEMHTMSLDQTLASALALALGEGWDDKISTGIQHLKGAKTLLNNALAQRGPSLQMGQLDPDAAKRLKFLSNTYVYLDAIARLTSREENDHIDLDQILQAVNEPMGHMECEIDPLMGCATTLFPLLGRVGSLIQRIRRTATNSLSVVSEANDLREQLLHWEPPDLEMFEQPEDPSSNVRHALHTAEAYRRAILLHLHSAVTELSSQPSYDQAKGILTMLAATPLSSRTMIVQIFPLLVGSCEMVSPEDRHWVTERWDAMMKRLRILNVSSCWDVVQEVWRRRDEWNRAQAQRMSRATGRTVSPTQFIPRRLKRKANSADALTEDDFLDTFYDGDDTAFDGHDQPNRRRLTSDASGNVVHRRQLFQLPRRHTDISLLSGEVEYTVRGRLHWLGVMSEWNWEVFLG